jgi:hypothetical protein
MGREADKNGWKQGGLRAQEVEKRDFLEKKIADVQASINLHVRHAF